MSDEPENQEPVLEPKAMQLDDDGARAERIRTLNDDLRRTMNGGRVMMTDGFLNLRIDLWFMAFKLVQEFDDFSEDNDPHKEHDFGAFTCGGEKIFWKIDYYDKEYCRGSPDPADPEVTTRVLTILLASEY